VCIAAAAAAAAAVAGADISIAALGGSITAGYIGESPDGSWVDSLVAWLKVCDVT
jgi:lysophospholipase L1-like esterase